LRIVDYKTGRSPSPRFQGEALFQLRFYALLLRLSKDQDVEAVLLYYLGNKQILRSRPTSGELDRTLLKIRTVWQSIKRMEQAKDFPPVKQPLCGWCSFRAACPLFGGVTPPLAG
jgi:putative RecB family exonuclease